MTDVPACFHARSEYTTWLYFRRQSKDNCNFCRDCTPEYQAEMVEAGRCAHPNVTFIPWEGGVIGVRPGERGKVLA